MRKYGLLVYNFFNSKGDGFGVNWYNTSSDPVKRNYTV